MTTPELYKLYEQHPSVQTDTRKLKKDDIFFALKGPNFNGNQFALQALAQGAAYAVVDEKINDDPRLIVVEDGLLALQELAKHHREQFDIPFIAITGSNGKTTSKELVSSVLASHFITYTTQGNLNNHIGVPLTILSIRKDAQMAVIEMGANHQKEIEGYCRYTQPTHGIITNIGKAHLEGFGGVDGVKKGKGELFDFLRAHNGTAFVFADYDYFREMTTGIKEVIGYGTAEGSVQGNIAESEPFLSVTITKGFAGQLPVQSRLVGDYNLPNILCAIAVGSYFGVPEENIRTAIESYTPSNSRSQLVIQGSNHIVLDAYNANPSSMKLAIENFARLHAAKKILMLGGMMELGPDSLREHQAIVDLIKQYRWADVVLVGGDFTAIAHGFTFFSSADEARKWFRQQALANAHVLIKGSRSMRMERILEAGEQ
ncbi:UDP-N-acetylmuramoyl-tripeptide--D-alanyl-D-alanine ligase [Sediminibacterium soli]|uniref:UDP-N-acetylmuramoyl-tripeptide--D-alanyl-D- alanine ligase n=1 Tax=Sediminibacterium soli TaxID=2698829 RepID=UPI00137A72B6|nr:UDP-N-acetylmuramoyl-tripeptide--D-alanyl-D-alanine ligase [Sediminibacterium soli]NCI45612.1 UDP-N-acetylmuramoyl-tripeptide--D-alanyl-D-alanine ligase [Sediminibacterium soli]